uniref:Uncharacterized protein n=1 Tax=Arundo donax TaxID=35708 RepID=A0A0A8YYE6_ARUDO
MDRSLPPV